MEVKVPTQISIIVFRLRVYTTRYTEHNKKINIEIVNKYLYEKVLNLASDPKEHYIIGLHITQN